MSVKKTKKQKNQHEMRNWLIIGFVIIVVGIGAFFLLNKDQSSVSGMPLEVNVSDAAARFEAGAFLLDVREPSEWNEGHVPGAALIPLGQLSSRISEVPTDQDVLIICRSGNRSAQARDILRSAGLDRTTSILGGINQWISAGLPTVQGP